MNPTTKAEIDFSQGSNSNPYKENSDDWRAYEQHFDTLCIEQQQLENGEIYARDTERTQSP